MLNAGNSGIINRIEVQNDGTLLVRGVQNNGNVLDGSDIQVRFLVLGY